MDEDRVRLAIGGDFGFRSEYRLHTVSEFSLVFASARVLRGDNFDLHFRSRVAVSTNTSTSARLGLVIGKKQAHHAVQRNVLKRLAREVFRHARQDLPPYDLVLRLSKLPRSKLDEATRRKLRDDVDRLLIRLPK